MEKAGFKNFTGSKIGSLTPVCPTKLSAFPHMAKWMCVCDCGRKVEMDLSNMQYFYCGSSKCTAKQNIRMKLSKEKLSEYPDLTVDEYIFTMCPVKMVKVGSDGGAGFYYCGPASRWDFYRERIYKNPNEHPKLCAAYPSICNDDEFIVISDGSLPGKFWTVNDWVRQNGPYV